MGRRIRFVSSITWTVFLASCLEPGRDTGGETGIRNIDPRSPVTTSPAGYPSQREQVRHVAATDLIAVVRPLSVAYVSEQVMRNGRTEEAQLVAADVEVRQVLSGNLPDRLQLRASDTSDRQRLTVGENSLVTLKLRPDGLYRVRHSFDVRNERIEALGISVADVAIAARSNNAE